MYVCMYVFHLKEFKLKREKERRKLMMQQNGTGWNANYVRQEAVIDTLADQHDVSRADILKTDGSLGAEDLAIRVAIGETEGNKFSVFKLLHIFNQFFILMKQ